MAVQLEEKFATLWVRIISLLALRRRIDGDFGNIRCNVLG